MPKATETTVAIDPIARLLESPDVNAPFWKKAVYHLSLMPVGGNDAIMVLGSKEIKPTTNNGARKNKPTRITKRSEMIPGILLLRKCFRIYLTSKLFRYLENSLVKP